MNIISNPGRVCVDHAMEFWTGTLAYSHARAGVCVKADQVCSCPRCVEMAEAFLKAAASKRAARPSPGDHEGFGIKLAS
jgi:hypothetical protein